MLNDWLTGGGALTAGLTIGWFVTARPGWKGVSAAGLLAVGCCGLGIDVLIAPTSARLPGVDYTPSHLIAVLVLGFGAGVALRLIRGGQRSAAAAAVLLAGVAATCAGVQYDTRSHARDWESARKLTVFVGDLCAIKERTLPANLDEFIDHTRSGTLLDGWGEPFVYVLDPGGRAATVSSAGRDGAPGTAHDLVQVIQGDCERRSPTRAAGATAKALRPIATTPPAHRGREAPLPRSPLSGPRG